MMLLTFTGGAPGKDVKKNSPKVNTSSIKIVYFIKYLLIYL